MSSPVNSWVCRNGEGHVIPESVVLPENHHPVVEGVGVVVPGAYPYEVEVEVFAVILEDEVSLGFYCPDYICYR